MQPEAGKKGREGVIVILSTAKAIGAHLYTCKFRDSMYAQLLGCSTLLYMDFQHCCVKVSA